MHKRRVGWMMCSQDTPYRWTLYKLDEDLLARGGVTLNNLERTQSPPWTAYFSYPRMLTISLLKTPAVFLIVHPCLWGWPDKKKPGNDGATTWNLLTSNFQRYGWYPSLRNSRYTLVVRFYKFGYDFMEVIDRTYVTISTSKVDLSITVTHLANRAKATMESHLCVHSLHE